MAIDDAKVSTDPSEHACQDALKQTADFVRFSSGLVTATLAFSFAFLSGPLAISDTARTLLYASWIVLLISLLASLVVFGVIPPKFEDRDCTLHDAALNVPGLIHLGTFLLGLVLLAIGVAIAFRPPADALPTAQAATQRAILALKKPDVQLVSVELINGIQATKSRDATWRVRLRTRPKARSATTTFEVLMNANTGRYAVYEGTNSDNK